MSDRRRRMHVLAYVARVARMAVLAASLLACQTAFDAPIPEGYRALVASAKESVISNYEGLNRPSLAVTELRCFDNGGVVILFRQVGGPTPGEPAFAMGGQQAAVPTEVSWSGGFGRIEEINEEIEFNFGNIAVVPCPPRAP